MILNELYESYSSKYQEYINEKQSYQDKIAESERKIEWHSRRKARYRKRIENLKYPYWTENMIRPIMAEVAKLTPDIKWEMDKTLKTFGLRCECPVFGMTEDGHDIAITFTRGAKINDIPYYDTGEVKNNFPSNSLGAINGMNSVSKTIESIDELVALVRKQEQEAKNHASE